MSSQATNPESQETVRPRDSMVSAIGVAEESTGEDLLDESRPVEETFECQECWPNVE